MPSYAVICVTGLNRSRLYEMTLLRFHVQFVMSFIKAIEPFTTDLTWMIICLTPNFFGPTWVMRVGSTLLDYHILRVFLLHVFLCSITDCKEVELSIQIRNIYALK